MKSACLHKSITSIQLHSSRPSGFLILSRERWKSWKTKWKKKILICISNACAHSLRTQKKSLSTQTFFFHESQENSLTILFEREREFRTKKSISLVGGNVPLSFERHQRGGKFGGGVGQASLVCVGAGQRTLAEETATLHGRAVAEKSKKVRFRKKTIFSKLHLAIPPPHLLPCTLAQTRWKTRTRVFFPELTITCSNQKTFAMY
jgi:hypothetical protein